MSAKATETHVIRLPLGEGVAETMEDLLDEAREDGHDWADVSALWPSYRKSGWYLKVDLGVTMERLGASKLADYITERLDSAFAYRFDMRTQASLRRVATEIQTSIRSRLRERLPSVKA